MPTTDSSKENAGRLKSFKNRGKDNDEMRRRRADVTVELRKARKDEQMLKRRNVAPDILDTTPLSETNNQQSVDLELPAIVEKIFSSDLQAQLAGVQAVRRLLSKARNPPLDDVIRSGVVPKLVEFLRSESKQLQFDSAWALTNIASGNSEQTRTVVQAGAVPLFINLLSSVHTEVRDQAVWALGNIAGDGSECRDFVIQCGIIQPLLTCITPTISIQHLRNIAWAISNLCRNKNPPPTMETITQLLPVLAQLINHQDKEIVSDSCWALSYMTDGPVDRIQTVINSGVINRLIELIGSGETSLVSPSLRAIGNVVTGNDEQTQLILNCGALQHFDTLLRHPRANIQKEAAWTVSNITAGQQGQIQAVIDANLIPALINILIKGEFRAQKEAVWAITNLTAGGTVQQILYTLQMSVLRPLCDMLVINDTKTILVVLDALFNILNAADKSGQVEHVCGLIEEYEGLDKVEALQQHENEEVYQLSLKIIDRFFSDQNDEVSSLAPSSSTGNLQFVPPTTISLPAGGFKF